MAPKAVIRRRALLTGVATIALTAQANAGFPGGFLTVGGGSASTNIATLTLVNESGSVSVAGTPTQSFGWLFSKGDLPSGSAPRFQVSGVTQPFSASVPAMRLLYDDGSTMFAVFALRPTFTIAGSGSQAVTIISGGSWPSTSTRTISEINSQSLAVSLPAASPSGANLTGTWGAWCDTVGNSANLINSGGLSTVIDLDGDAGTRWTLNFHLSQTKGGTKHGQAIYTFYVWALNNSSGNLGGFRWSGYARQPWYNLAGEGSTVPAKNNRAFTAPDYVTPANGPNWSASGVSATPMGFKGNDNNPMLPVTFTVSTPYANAPTHNYYLGGQAGNVVPCYFTTTGTLPAPLTTTDIFGFVAFSPAGTQPLLQVFSDPSAGTSLSLSGGSGTHTIHPIVGVNQFCRLGFKDDNGRSLFFTGTGTISAETTLRGQIDRTKWQATGLIPPWDLTQASIPNGGAITESFFVNLWHPHSIGSAVWDANDQTGVVQPINFLPNDAGLDFYNQSAQSERSIRAIANGVACLAGDFRDATTNSLMNISATTYTGLPASVATTVLWGSGGSAGFTAPPFTGQLLSSQGSNEHQPCFAGWAWLRFGEPEYCEFLKEQAILGPLGVPGGHRNTSKPVVGRQGLSLGFGGQYRSLAWRKRNYAMASKFCPYDPISGLDLDGTKTTQQLRDLSAQDWQQVKDTMNPANNYFGTGSPSPTTYMTTRGLWTPFCDLADSDQGNYLTVSPEWEFTYIVYSACLEALLGDVNAQYFLNLTATRWDYVRATFGANGHGLWNLPSYYNAWGIETSSLGHIGPSVISSDTNWLCLPNFNALTYSGSTFTLTGTNNGFIPATGDVVEFDSVYTTVPPLLTSQQGYYVINCVYNGGTDSATFQVSATPGGSAIAVTGSGNPYGGCAWTSYSAPTTGWSNEHGPNAVGTDGFYGIVEAARWSKAALTKLGLYTTQFDNILTDFNFRLANTAGSTTSMLQTLSGGTSDVRYCVADHFG